MMINVMRWLDSHPKQQADVQQHDADTSDVKLLVYESEMDSAYLSVELQYESSQIIS